MGMTELGNSKLGQITGFMMKNWSFTSKPQFLDMESDKRDGSLELFGDRVVATNPAVVRIVSNAGPAVMKTSRLCKDILGKATKEVYLPKWFYTDVFVKMAEEKYLSISLIQTVNEETRKSRQFFYAEQTLLLSSESEDCQLAGDNGPFWNKTKDAFAKWGLEEFWSKMTGTVKPCWGMLSNVKKGDILTGTENYHICCCPADHDAVFPDYQDQYDLSRIETLLAQSGLKQDDFLRPGISKNYILYTIERLSKKNSISDVIEG